MLSPATSAAVLGHAQRCRHRAPVRRQDRANQKHLSFDPGAPVEYCREGLEQVYNIRGQGEHFPTFLDPKVSLPCLSTYGKSVKVVQSRAQMGK